MKGLESWVLNNVCTTVTLNVNMQNTDAIKSL